MATKEIRRCSGCGQVFAGTQASQRILQHEAKCRVLRIRSARLVSTAPAALAAEPVAGTHGPGEQSNVSLGSDTDFPLSVPDPVLDSVPDSVSPPMTREETTRIVRLGRTMASTMTIEQFVQRMLDLYPHWSIDLLRGVFDGCLPSSPIPNPSTTPSNEDVIWIDDD